MVICVDRLNLTELEKKGVLSLFMYMKGGIEVNRTESHKLDWISYGTWIQNLNLLKYLKLVNIETKGREMVYTLNEQGERIAGLLSQVEDILKE